MSSIALPTSGIQHLLTCTRMLIDQVHYVQQSFHLVPDRNHTGTSINYIDLQERRKEFCEELINTSADWVYNQDKAAKILKDLESDGRSRLAAQQAFAMLVKSKFRRSASDKIVQQGQFGELLLFNFLQHFFSAVPLLRKMPITTDLNMERFGADAIHYSWDLGKHLIYLGEAKAYTSKYSFAGAFEDALSSILKSYKNHSTEIKHFVYDSFIDDNLLSIANSYKNGQLKNTEVHLVCLIAYHETMKLNGSSEAEIKKNIMNIISQRGQSLKREIFDLIPSNLYPRFNYIILPIWNFDDLMTEFKNLIG